MDFLISLHEYGLLFLPVDDEIFSESNRRRGRLGSLILCGLSNMHVFFSPAALVCACSVTMDYES
jgi:hypothetical protein